MTNLIEEVVPPRALDDYERETANIMTGMTYDASSQGEPIDYLKQVFAAFDIAEYLEQNNVETTVNLLVADSEPYTRPEDQGYSDIRGDYLEAIGDAYSGNFSVEVDYTSQVEDQEWANIRDRLAELVEEDQDFADLILETVPPEAYNPDASDVENTLYARSEIATIMKMGTDIKTGPHAEKGYDFGVKLDDVQKIGGLENGVIGVYVSNSVPVRKNEAESKLKEDTGDWEEYQEKGLTPYKAGSKDLDPERHRVLLQDSEKNIREKLEKTPPELRYDLEALNSFMNRQQEEGFHPDLAHSLNQNLERIRDRL